MSVDIIVPAVGESVAEVILASWLKKDGDFVQLDESICEVESEKVAFEVPAPAAGILRITAQAGDTIPIGASLGSIEESATKAAASTSTVVSEPVKESVNTSVATSVVEVVIPVVAESVTQVTVGSIFKKTGDFVKLDEPICELESEKATFELNATASGTIEVLASTEQVLEIGAVFAKITVGAASTSVAPSKTAPIAEKTVQESASSASYASGHASPAAAKILSEKGMSAQEVQGSGVGGRITKEDAQNANKVVASPAKKAEVAATVSQEPLGPRSEKTERMTPLRKTIAKRLVAAKNHTAMLTTFNEVDMSGIYALRNAYKDKFKEKYEIGLGFMSFFTKACTIALQEFPAVNAQIDGDEIRYHNYCDISIAVSSPRGLVVPVIRNAEMLSLAGVEKEVRRLAIRARDSKLTIPEMEGGTFTITNGGVFGSMLSTPIINAPQSAILGMHNVVDRPVAVNGKVEIRPIMYVALSYDHRIIDGRESVSFLFRVKELLEDPARMLLEI